MSKVTREKYENMKKKAQSWYDKAFEYEGDIENLTHENQELKQSLKTEQNSEYFKENQQLKQSLYKLKSALEKLQKYGVSNNDYFKENQKLQETIKNLNTKIMEIEHEKNNLKILHEKQILQKDAQIERLKLYLENLKEN